MTRYLADRAVSEGLPSLTAVLGKPEDPLIPEKVELVLQLSLADCSVDHRLLRSPALKLWWLSPAHRQRGYSPPMRRPGAGVHCAY